MTDAPGRARAYRITAGALGIVLATAGFALLSLIGGWFGLGDRAVHRIHDIVWGLLGGILIATGLIVQARRPERWIAPAQQAIVGTAALTLGFLIGGEPLFAAAGPVLVGVVVALHPERGRLVHGGEGGISLPMLALAVAALVPLVVYALDQAEIQRACPPADAHCAEFHWAQVAALALALPPVGVVAALRAPGWRLTAWCAGIAAGLWGIASLAFPANPSALGDGWAIAAVAGGAVFIGLAEWERRRP